MTTLDDVPQGTRLYLIDGTKVEVTVGERTRLDGQLDLRMLTPIDPTVKITYFYLLTTKILEPGLGKMTPNNLYFA